VADSEPKVRVAARCEHARPLLDQFRSWLDSRASAHFGGFGLARQDDLG
jgi:hypothetical protein